jgi:hypothetical protein
MGWTGDANGTENNQATGLAGAYAKQLNDVSGTDTTAGRTLMEFAPANSIYTYGLIQLTYASITVNTVHVFGVGSDTSYCLLSVAGAAGPAPYFKVISSGTGATDTGYGTLSSGTVYAIWLEYNNNTADTGCSVYITTATCSGTPPSCTATKPALTKGITTNNSGTANGVYLRSLDQVSSGDADPIIFDNIKVKATAIGDDGI